MKETTVYSRSVLDFVTVSAEYCRQVEQCAEAERQEFVRIMLSLLPMVYLRASLVGDIPDVAGYNEPKVTEDDYNYVRQGVSRLLGADDDYLDVFAEDFKYSDQPVLQTVSENLADVYQALRNLVEVFRGGHEEAMTVAVVEALDEFRLHWGQKLLGALRALHDLRYSSDVR